MFRGTFRRLAEGHQISASEINRALAGIESLMDLTVTAPIKVDRGASGYHLSIELPEPTFWIEILGGTGPGYTSWQQVIPDGQGGHAVDPNGLSGDGTLVAWEANGQAVPAGAFCPAWRTHDGLGVTFLYSPIGPTVRADDGPDVGPRRRLNFLSDPSGALTIGAVDDPGSGEIDVSFTVHLPTIIAALPAYPVTLGGDDNYAEPLMMPPGQPTAIVIGNGGGFSIYSGVNVLVFDYADGFATSQPVAGQATVNLLDATETQRGIVSLTAQYVGSGNKYFKDKVGVGFTTPTVPLTNSALDVRGHTYSYFAGALSFGGGNSPTAETDGAILQYKVTGRKVVCEVPTAAQFAGQAVGYEVQGNGCAFVLRYQDAGDTLPCFAIYNDLTGLFYAIGGTATVGGMVFKGGLYDSGTPSPSLVIGTTPVSGGSTDDFLNIDSGGHLNRISGPFFTGTL